jgi:ribosomal protein L12E/L44/L45/RPP1/RPP2
MRAPTGGPQNGQEAAMLRLFQQAGSRQQRAWLDALIRRVDGQPLEEAFVEAFVELGYSPRGARQEVRAAFERAPDWRAMLN